MHCIAVCIPTQEFNITFSGVTFIFKYYTYYTSLFIWDFPSIGILVGKAGYFIFEKNVRDYIQVKLRNYLANEHI